MLRGGTEIKQKPELAIGFLTHKIDKLFQTLHGVHQKYSNSNIFNINFLISHLTLLQPRGL